jgi:hypothetical protein
MRTANSFSQPPEKRCSCTIIAISSGLDQAPYIIVVSDPTPGYPDTACLTTRNLSVA